MKYSLSSILLSLIVICAAVWVNSSIAQDYLQSDGKTRALFGLIELFYTFKYYFLIGSMISGILLVLAYREKEKLQISAVIFLSVSVLSVVLKVWKWFV